MNTEDRQILTVEQADAMMPDGDQVHTFISTTFGLIGADWSREEALECFRKNGVELSGPMASSMGHGIVSFTETDAPVFFATKKS